MTLAKKAVSPENLRRARRDLVDFGARATGCSGVHDIQVVNVSPLGLMGRIKTDVTAGDKLLFELPHVRRVESVVRWVEDGRIGVEFSSAIEADRYKAMLAYMPQRQTNW
ncbi:MAG: PilZ domain-containing protein [Sphingobium sp.]